MCVTQRQRNTVCVTKRNRGRGCRVRHTGRLRVWEIQRHREREVGRKKCGHLRHTETESTVTQENRVFVTETERWKTAWERQREEDSE